MATVPHSGGTVRGSAVARANTLRAAGFVAVLGGLGFLVLVSIGVGTKTIPIGDVWRLLWHDDGSSDSIVIHELRIPRTALGLLVGAALGLSGALIQALTLNPLADPGILGINLGAATAVVVAIAFIGVSSFSGYVWFAFLGAGIASTIVFALGSTGRSATPERQVLAGVAVSAVLGAFVWAVLVTHPTAFDQYRYWDVGSLANRGSETLSQVAPFIVAGIALALGLARSLNALALGEEAGRALGANVLRTRALGILAVTLLCGAATAAAGPIVFVGLAVPHIARMITGPDQRWVFAYSVLLAPILLLGADVIGRVAVRPSELEVGIVTAFLGAPVFIALCHRRRIAQL
jgi:iron complex transport system permease protein